MNMSIEEKVASFDEKFKTLFNKMEKIETQTDNIHQLTLSINKIALNLETLTEQTKRNTDDIEEMKEIEANKYNELIKYITLTIVGAVVGYILKAVGIK